MGSTFKPSKAGIREMINADFMVAEMHRRAEKIKQAAEGIAPVGGPGDPHPGLYKASFEVESGTEGGVHHDRAYGRVTNTAPYSYEIEFGSKNVPKYRVLGKALGAAGDD